MAALSASLNVTARTTAWTYDESHDDVRRMVISRSMVNKQASVHRDSRGMRYSQLPPYYGLCYAITYTNIYNLCKTIEVDRYGNQWLFDDECFTIYKWLERLEEATGISRNNGLYECKIRDGLVLIMLIACSDNLETVPRPAARIQAFKDFLRVTIEPVVRRINQPKRLRVMSRSPVELARVATLDDVDVGSSSKSRTCTWTCDENDKDFRRLVFSPSMLNQKADVHLDRLGRSYAQLPPYYGLCYAITYTNIYNLCKALQVDRDGERIFFGDKCFTIYKWFERLEAATGVSRDFGLYECELKNGQPILVMVIACSDKAETVPRPAARIEAFKRFLRIAREPMLRRFNQPKDLGDARGV
ncbi:hypothetical protein K523DRAFT_384546 [Schizophyllum commune Tattone D]|nr:hypothetical protein K523DRAFT_384546 [Schizophyllum commune Tattone D]